MASFYETSRPAPHAALLMPQPSESQPEPAEVRHVPVLPDLVLAQLQPKPGQVLLDCTVGRGGHSALLLPHLVPGGRVIGLDLDEQNLAFSRDRLTQAAAPTDQTKGVSNVHIDLTHANFASARSVLDGLDIDGVHLLLADFGFASNQMDDPRRGFSFDADGPLDMRMDRSADLTAADLIAELDERQLADLIYRYGEERRSRAIARKIVASRRQRPIKTTGELAHLVCTAYGGRRQRIHPATRTFMALRIAVNGELANIEQLLADLPRLLRPGARAALISFHSLEDRLVKQAFRAWSQDDRARLLTRKPLTAGEQEQHSNPRSRSAKMRVLEWID